jgi:iron uptake system component EfeO
MRPTHLTLLPAAALAALVLAACGGSSASSSPAASASGGASPAAGTVKVTASEMQFDPSSMTVPAGEVTFEVTNAGTIEHEFEIFKGDTVVDEVEGLVPGVTLPLTVELEAGDYTYVCKVAGHEEAGMKGTLTVTG